MNGTPQDTTFLSLILVRLRNGDPAARHDLIQHACDRLRRLTAKMLSDFPILASRRYELAQVDWRSLRGIPFEDFLAEVCRELGYFVETTKASGDQGVDLILTGKGSRIAVQAKGYGDSVGNGAIQEVHTGMIYYECDRCVAVTNSTFTSAAKELAAKVGCLLVDGSQIPDLIEGRIL